MTRTLIDCMGPELNHAAAYHYNNSTTGWTLTAAPAPPHGTYWLTKIGTESNHITTNSGAITPGTVQWIVGRGYRIEGTLTSGNEIGVFFTSLVAPGVALYLRAIGQSDGTYKMQIEYFPDVGGSTDYNGTTSYDVSTTYTVRITFDGSNITLEMDGSEEITFSSGAKKNNHSMTFLKEGVPGVTLKLNRWAFFNGDSGADRPGVAVEIDRLDLTGNHSTKNVWGGDFTDYDDYNGGGGIDESDKITSTNNGDEEMADVATHTPTDTIEGVKLYLWLRANGANKTANWSALVSVNEGTPDSLSRAAMTNQTYRARMVVFPLDPGGEVWSQADIDELEIGIRHVGGDTQTLCAAIGVELCSVDDDPAEEEEAVLPRVGPAMMSANMGVF